MKYKTWAIVSLTVGLVGTIGFGTMWGISANNTYQFKDGTTVGIGINNYNCSWDKSHVLIPSKSHYDSYPLFIRTMNNDHSKDKEYVNTINTNYNLWISGVVLTALNMSLIGLTLIGWRLKLLHNTKNKTNKKL